MFLHYLKIAFRNLIKYKTQTIISIIGLSIGFTCFALSAYWIRYELSFDNFHKDVDKIYQVRQRQIHNSVIINSTSQSLYKLFEKEFPYIKTCFISETRKKFKPGKNQISYNGIEVNKEFLDIFEIDIIAGRFDDSDPLNILITENFAKTLFNDSNPLGKKITYYIMEHCNFNNRQTSV